MSFLVIGTYLAPPQVQGCVAFPLTVVGGRGYRSEFTGGGPVEGSVLLSLCWAMVTAKNLQKILY